MKVLESACILGFSGKSLLKERMVEIILGKGEFKKIYHIFLLTLTINIKSSLNILTAVTPLHTPLHFPHYHYTSP